MADCTGSEQRDQKAKVGKRCRLLLQRTYARSGSVFPQLFCDVRSSTSKKAGHLRSLARERRSWALCRCFSYFCAQSTERQRTTFLIAVQHTAELRDRKSRLRPRSFSRRADCAQRRQRFRRCYACPSFRGCEPDTCSRSSRLDQAHLPSRPAKCPWRYG